MMIMMIQFNLILQFSSLFYVLHQQLKDQYNNNNNNNNR
jgi:hypothetical protein